MKRLIVLLITLGISIVGITPSNATTDRGEDRASRSAPRTALNLTTMNAAESFIGVRYCKGGKTPRCFDCSGLIQYIYGQQGISLPGHVSGQLKRSTIIPREEAMPGDLVFFVTKSGYAYHAGIYIGNNQMIHSPKPGRKVRVETIWSSRVKFGTIS